MIDLVNMILRAGVGSDERPPGRQVFGAADVFVEERLEPEAGDMVEQRLHIVGRHAARLAVIEVAAEFLPQGAHDVVQRTLAAGLGANVQVQRQANQ